MSRTGPLVALAVVVGGLALLGYAIFDNPTKIAAQTPQATPSPKASGSDEVTQKMIAQMLAVRAEEEAKRNDELKKNRAGVVAEIKRLMGAGKWDEARAKARSYDHTGDAEIAKLADRATKGAEEKNERDQKAYLRSRGVTIGMTPSEVHASKWGKPKSVNRTTSAYGTREQWVYGGGNYLYFENGVLTSIQN